MKKSTKEQARSGHADIIRTFRQRLGLSQRKFAEVLGVKQVTVHRWEAGHSAPCWPTIQKLAQLREASGVSVKFFPVSTAKSKWVQARVVLRNVPGALEKLAGVIAKGGSNVDYIQGHTDSDHIDVDFEVADKAHGLTQLARIEGTCDVISVAHSRIADQPRLRRRRVFQKDGHSTLAQRGILAPRSERARLKGELREFLKSRGFGIDIAEIGDLLADSDTIPDPN